MSHTILQGNPTESQLYLDKVLDGVRKRCKMCSGCVKGRQEVNAAEILFYSLKNFPDEIFMINSSTGEHFTNDTILKGAISIARALLAMGWTKKTAILMVRNHEHMAKLYYGLIFAGVFPLMLEPNSTELELKHFVDLVNPTVLFCEPKRMPTVKAVASEAEVIPNIIAVDQIPDFTRGVSDDPDHFPLPDVLPDKEILMMPTSGSTGLSKAAVLTHKGLISQSPSLWMDHLHFPKPTKLALLLSTVQWMTHSILMISAPVYQVTLIMSPSDNTTDAVRNIIKDHKPTWTLMNPGFAASVLGAASSASLRSLETVLLTGSPPSSAALALLQEKLPSSSRVLNGYGMTELHGFGAIPSISTPNGSIGKIFNFYRHKIVDNEEKELGPNTNGELYISGPLFKGYYQNKSATKETLSSDGWLKTGDLFHQDDEGNLFFVERLRFWFKYLSYHIAPEEVEQVILSVPGVQECVVCGVEVGPAAAVVLFPGYRVTREDIHRTVETALSDYKRLRGGIVFVSSIPLTHSGKYQRSQCRKLIEKLREDGLCY